MPSRNDRSRRNERRQPHDPSRPPRQSESHESPELSPDVFRGGGEFGFGQIDGLGRSTAQGDDGLYEMRGGLASRTRHDQRFGEQQRDDEHHPTPDARHRDDDHYELGPRPEQRDLHRSWFGADGREDDVGFAQSDARGAARDDDDERDSRSPFRGSRHADDQVGWAQGDSRNVYDQVEWAKRGWRDDEVGWAQRGSDVGRVYSRGDDGRIPRGMDRARMSPRGRSPESDRNRVRRDPRGADVSMSRGDTYRGGSVGYGDLRDRHIDRDFGHHDARRYPHDYPDNTLRQQWMRGGLDVRDSSLHDPRIERVARAWHDEHEALLHGHDGSHGTHAAPTRDEYRVRHDGRRVVPDQRGAHPHDLRAMRDSHHLRGMNDFVGMRERTRDQGGANERDLDEWTFESEHRDLRTMRGLRELDDLTPSTRESPRRDDMRSRGRDRTGRGMHIHTNSIPDARRPSPERGERSEMRRRGLASSGRGMHVHTNSIPDRDAGARMHPDDHRDAHGEDHRDVHGDAHGGDAHGDHRDERMARERGRLSDPRRDRAIRGFDERAHASHDDTRTTYLRDLRSSHAQRDMRGDHGQSGMRYDNRHSDMRGSYRLRDNDDNRQSDMRDDNRRRDMRGASDHEARPNDRRGNYRPSYGHDDHGWRTDAPRDYTSRGGFGGRGQFGRLRDQNGAPIDEHLDQRRNYAATPDELRERVADHHEHGELFTDENRDDRRLRGMRGDSDNRARQFASYHDEDDDMRGQFRRSRNDGELGRRGSTGTLDDAESGKQPRMSDNTSTGGDETHHTADAAASKRATEYGEAATPGTGPNNGRGSSNGNGASNGRR